MSDGVKFEMPDMTAYLAELKALPTAMREKVMRGAVASGAAVVRRAAVALAPEWDGVVGKGHPAPGTLKKAIYQVRMPEKCSHTSEVFKVDVRTGGTRAGKGGTRVALPDAFYAVWVERGHYTRTPGMTQKQHRKARLAGLAAAGGATWVPPHPFMRPAFESNKTAAERAMQDYIDSNLPLATAAMKFIKALP